MKLIKYILITLLLAPSITASVDESLEECGLVACIFLFDDGFDPEYFETLDYIQAERSKREDSFDDEMRCSEHCGNTMREVQ